MSVPIVASARPPQLREWHDRALDRSAPPHTSRLLRFSCFALFLFPSTMVIKPIGASGTVPLLLALLLLVVWVASSLWGLHDPVQRRSPARLAAGVFVLGVLISYVALYGGWSGSATTAELASADRWVLFAFASLAMVLVIGDAVRSVSDVLQLSRWVLAGAFFSCLVGVVQFAFQVNPMEWVEAAMPGFTDNGGDTPFQQRGALVRVAGSAFHSIEFGVTSAMLLPLSIWRALFDPRGLPWFHWLQTILLIFAVTTTVSRSGTLAVAVALAVMLPFLPRPARRRVLVALPFLVLALFLAVPGFLGTMSGAITADTRDPSIATRVNNYPRVARLIDERPLFGTGPGTYLPTDALEILDNEYLNAVVSLGIVGLLAVTIYLLLPAFATIHAARHAQGATLRCLAGAVAAGLLVGAVCSATFDSLSFPIFGLLYPMLAGIAASVWILVRRESELRPPLGPSRTASPTRHSQRMA